MLMDEENLKAIKTDEMLKSIRKYHDAVKMLFDKDSDEIFPNNNEEHTAAIIEEIFLHAKQEIKVFCTRFSHDVWGNPGVTNAFINALFRGVEIKVATQEAMDGETLLTGLCRDKELPIQVKENVAKNLDFNFIVADKKMFRYEKNAKERHAIACANNSEIAGMLDTIYEGI